MSGASLDGLLHRYRQDGGFRAWVGAMGSLAASAAFALYNGIAGLAYRAPWNGSICVYYLLLAEIRGYLWVNQRRLAGLPRSKGRHMEKRACATAAYATWKITLASVRYRRRKRSEDGFAAQLRTVALVDALVSVLTLQNTLIMVKSAGGGRSMLTLAALTCAVIFAGIVAVSVANWRRRKTWPLAG